jgi:hypothetical protein
MINHLLSHMKQNLIAYFALFVALGGTSYAAPQIAAMHHSAKSAKGGITCGGACPASRVYWVYVGVHGGPLAQINRSIPSTAAPNTYQTAVGAVSANLVHQGLGDWLVKFKSTDLSNCARFVNLTHDLGFATAAGYDRFNPDPTAVHVTTADVTGQPADLDFVVMAVCGNSKGLQTQPAPPGTGVGGQ